MGWIWFLPLFLALKLIILIMKGWLFLPSSKKSVGCYFRSCIEALRTLYKLSISLSSCVLYCMSCAALVWAVCCSAGPWLCDSLLYCVLYFWCPVKSNRLLVLLTLVLINNCIFLPPTLWMVIVNEWHAGPLGGKCWGFGAGGLSVGCKIEEWHFLTERFAWTVQYRRLHSSLCFCIHINCYMSLKLS